MREYTEDGIIEIPTQFEGHRGYHVAETSGLKNLIFTIIKGEEKK